MKKDDECLFWGYKLGSGSEKGRRCGTGGPEVDGSRGGPVPFPPCPPCLSKAGREGKSLLLNDLRRLPPCPPSSPKIPFPKSTQASTLSHPFLPALPAFQELGGKVSLSYTMTYEGFLPAPPAPRKFLSLNRRKPAP
jgi:hypothetical protein